MSNELPDLGSPSLADLIKNDPDAQAGSLLNAEPLTLSKVQPSQVEVTVGLGGPADTTPIVNETPPPPAPEYPTEESTPESVISPLDTGLVPGEVVIPVVPVQQPQVSVEQAPIALPGEETPEQTVARLQREIAANAPAVAAAQAATAAKQAQQRPKPESELTEEERMIRRLQDQVAQQQAQLLENSEDVYDMTQGEPGSVIRIHILKEGGITLNGTSWYRGQVIDFVIGSQAYLDTFDRLGFSPLQIVDNPAAQFKRWGEIRYGVGDWPGLPSEDPSVLHGEARRNFRAPVIPTR